MEETITMSKNDYMQPSISPLQKMQLLTVDQLFTCMDLDQSKNYKGYSKATRHLSSLLRKYTPDNMKEEIDSLYEKEELWLKHIKEEGHTGERLQQEIHNARQTTADQVFHLCCQALTHSPIISETEHMNLQSDINWDKLKQKVNTSSFPKAIKGDIKKK